MRDLVLPDFVVYISMTLALVSVFGFIFMNRITDWMIEREERKKSAAAAAADAAPAASPAGHPAAAPSASAASAA